MMRHRTKRVLLLGLSMGAGLAMGLVMLGDRGRIGALEARVAQLEVSLLNAVAVASRVEQPQTQPEVIAASDAPPLEVSGWFLDRPVAGPRGHYMIQPQLRNTTGRDIQMIDAFLMFRTKTGDVICAMDLTRNQSIKAGQTITEPQSHRIGWERLQKLNLNGLKARDIVAELHISKVVFSDL